MSYAALGQPPPAPGRLDELRCRSHGGQWMTPANICDYGPECAEQGLVWKGDVEPSGKPICVPKQQVMPTPPRSTGGKTTSSGVGLIGWVLPAALIGGGLYLLIKKRR